MLRDGSRASSARFETVSIPVYAIMPTGIASKNWPHVGATPKWTFSASVLGLKMRTKPSRTSRTCVEKSITARKTFSFADSWIPTMFRATRKTITTVPPITSQGFVLNGSQKIER